MSENIENPVTRAFQQHQGAAGLFLGTITATVDDYGDVERDGRGPSWLSKLVPRVLKRRTRNIIDSLEPEALTVKQFTEDSTSTLKFYHKTKIMEVSNGSVTVEAVDSPHTPVEGKFIKECKGDFDSSHLRNETESLYIVLKYKELQLKSVAEDRLDDTDLYTFITIYSTNDVQPGDPDTALYFPAMEDSKLYHYYLAPQDTPNPQGTVMVTRCCVDKLSEEEINDVNRKHMVFTQTYSNQGVNSQQVRATVQHTSASQSNGAQHKTDQLPTGRHFKLSSEVEKD